jgi:hypothetical protein
VKGRVKEPVTAGENEGRLDFLIPVDDGVQKHLRSKLYELERPSGVDMVVRR